MCRKYPRRCMRRAQNNTTDTKTRNEANKHNASDKANKHVPVIAMDDMNEMTDDTNNPTLAAHGSCSEGTWAGFTKKKGEQNKVANIIRGLRYSKVVIKSSQEPAVRSVERNVVESLSEDGFKELCGCQVVMQHSQWESRPPMKPLRKPFNECKEK